MTRIFGFLLLFLLLVTVINSSLGYSLESPNIIQRPEMQSILVNSSTYFACLVLGNPPPNIRWQVNGEYVSSTNYDKFIETTNKLLGASTLRVKSADNDKLITCSAENSLGRKTATANLTVLKTMPLSNSGFPFFTDKFSIMVFSKGDKVTLTCNNTGLSPTRVFWYFNSLLITASDSRYQMNNNHHHLFIPDLTEQHEGNYECRAENSLGSSLSTQFNLHVRHAPLPPAEPPRLLHADANSLYLTWPVQSTSSSSPSLSSSSSPIVLYQVIAEMILDKNDGDNGGDGQEIMTTSINDNKMIVIQNVSSSSSGSSSIDWMKVNVSGLRSFTKYKITLRTMNSNQEFSNSTEPVIFTTNESIPGDAPRDLHLKVGSKHILYVTWKPPLQPNGQIKNYRLYYTENVDLPIGQWQSEYSNLTSKILTRLSPNLNYHVRVSAINNVGEGPHTNYMSIFMRIGMLPKPTNFRAVTESYSQIRLHWDKASKQLIENVNEETKLLGYEISNAEVDKTINGKLLTEFKKIEQLLQPEAIDCLIDNLKPNTIYRFQLAAISTSGPGMFAYANAKTAEYVSTTPLWFTTTPLTVMENDSNPQHILLEAINSTSLKFSWAEPRRPQKSIRAFNIILEEEDLSSTAGGKSGNFKFISRKTVSAGAGGSFEFPNLQQQHVIFNNLTSNTLYRVKLILVFQGSPSTPFYSQSVRTHQPMPKPPRNLVSQISFKCQPFCIILTWNEPNQPNLPNSMKNANNEQVKEYLLPKIIDYEITYKILHPLDMINALIVQKELTNKMEFSSQPGQLYLGTVYEFSVAARNEYVVGEAARVIITTPEAAPSDSPKDVNASFVLIKKDEEIEKEGGGEDDQAKNPTSISLSWYPPQAERRNGNISQYEIHCEPLKTTLLSLSTWLNVSGELTSAIVSNLQESTQYSCAVRAWTRQGGAGPWSEVVRFLTKYRRLSPPNFIRAIRLNSQQMFVTWQLPDNQSLALCSAFVVFYNTRDDPHRRNEWKKMIIENVTTVAYLNNLDEGSTYAIRMSLRRRGFDSDDGQWSTAVVEESLPQDHALWIRPEKLDCFAFVNNNAEDGGGGGVGMQLTWSLSRSTWMLLNNHSLFLHYRLNFTGVRQFTNQIGQTMKEYFTEVEQILLPNDDDGGGGVGEGGKETEIQTRKIQHKLQWNTRYEFSLQFIFKKGSRWWGEPVTKVYTTPSTKPESVASPRPTAIDQLQSIGSAVITLQLPRVSQKFGEIHRYYLIVVSKNWRDSVSMATDSTIPLNKFISNANKQNNNVEIKKRFRRNNYDDDEMKNKQIILFAMFNARELFQDDVDYYAVKVGQVDFDSQNTNYATIYKHERLEKNVDYFAVLIACIKSNNNKTTTVIESSEQTSIDMQQKLCTSSSWSLPFNSERPLPLPMSSDDSTLDAKSTLTEGRSSSSSSSPSSPSLSSMSIAGPIIGIFVLIICILSTITFCILRNRRHKQQHRRTHGRYSTSSHGNCNVNSTTVGLRNGLLLDDVDQGKQLLLTNGHATTTTTINNKGSNNLLLHPLLNNQTTQSSGKTITTTSPFHLQSNNNNNNLLSTTSTTTTALPIISTLYTTASSGQGSICTGGDLSIHRQTPGALSSSHTPISLTRLSDYIQELKSNDNYLFQQEYENIDPGQQFTWHCSTIEWNKKKNRYANVIAYDHSRVVLQPLLNDNGQIEPGSDYINANYLDGYRQKNAYIATQGPLDLTMNDFWRMIWQQRCNLIVMMTRLEERARTKCEQYWPSNGTQIYGHVMVTLLSQSDFAYYTMRIMEVRLRGSSEHYEVRQMQFTAWPDHGVPHHTIPLLMFVRRVRALVTPGDVGPMVVHCSAGVGRTGAFIAIDAQLERMSQEYCVDVYDQVTSMRAQRNYMVQTDDQYQFVYEVLLEAVQCGQHSTEVTINQLNKHVSYLLDTMITNNVMAGGGMESTSPVDLIGSTSPLHLNTKSLANSANTNNSTNNTSTTSALSVEFARLSKFCGRPSAQEVENGNAPMNQHKNRLVSVLPLERTRVQLKPLRGVVGSDYINANFIDGYRRTQAYIATQAPLADTVEDFWRMLWECECSLVVMLTQCMEAGREKSIQYWPNPNQSTRFNYLIVDPIREYPLASYVMREFRVTDSRDNTYRTIRQFQFLLWPTVGVPHLTLIGQENDDALRICESLWDLIDEVHKTQKQFGLDGPVVVHCSAGTGRTGIFLCLSILLDRMRTEGLIDVFMIVKLLRSQRPLLVHTEDQYRFCYQALVHYLRSIDSTPAYLLNGGH